MSGQNYSTFVSKHSINFFDCAEAYGSRQAERALGIALHVNGRRHEAVIATKFGRHAPLWETDDPTGAQVVYDGRAVDAALRRPGRFDREVHFADASEPDEVGEEGVEGFGGSSAGGTILLSTTSAMKTAMIPAEI